MQIEYLSPRCCDVVYISIAIGRLQAPSHRLELRALLCSYVHRVGRTGRAGNSGTAISLITPRDSELEQDLAASMPSTTAEDGDGEPSCGCPPPPRAAAKRKTTTNVEG